MPDDTITILEADSTGRLLVALAQRTGSYAGQYSIVVRRGEPSRNPLHARLREALGDPAAAIIAVPTLRSADYWAAWTGNRAAVTSARAEG